MHSVQHVPSRAGGSLDELVGECEAMRRLRTEIEAVSASDATVLLGGETGTGKGLAARALHRASRRAGGPFVHVDCAALAPSVIESELFGHERGAFTGASARRIGRFEAADRGTIFLDEITELTPPLQAKLLRVLQDRTYERVGGSRTLLSRARVVAASNRNLHAEISAGRMRADLYYRLQVVELRIPSLRERLVDLPLLVRARLLALGARPLPRITADFHARLGEHDWPGNVRELANLIERLWVRWPGSRWDAALLDGLMRPARSTGSPAASRYDFRARERAQLSLLLDGHRWNVSAAARALGVSRGALRGRIERLGLIG